MKKNLPDVVTGVNFTAHSGNFFVFLAETEPEKLLFLKLISGYYKPLSGEVKTYGKVCLLPQQPQAFCLSRKPFMMIWLMF